MSETKFDRHGHEFRLAKSGDGNQLAWMQYVDHDGEPHGERLCLIPESELFNEPPKQKINDEIAVLEAKLSDLRDQLQAQRQEVAIFEEDAAERMARLKQHKALERLDDYLAGRITHYVGHRYTWEPPELIVFDDAKCEYNPKDGLKLLTLFGDSKGNLSFGLNRYSDGSSVDSTVIPCVSLDAAGTLLSKIFATHEKEALDPEHKTTPKREWVKQATKYGIAMNDKYVLAIEEREASEKQAKIAKLESTLKELRADP